MDEREQRARELARRVQQHRDERAFAELLALLDAIIKNSIRRYARWAKRKRLNIDSDDFYQHASIHIWRTLTEAGKSQYDESKLTTTGVAGFFGYIIKLRSNTLYRKLNHKYSEQLNRNALSLDMLRIENKTLHSIIEDKRMPLDDQADDEIESIAREIGENLSKLEAACLYLHRAGQSYSEIGEQIGISAKSVDNSMSRIKNKCQSLLEKRGVIDTDMRDLNRETSAKKKQDNRRRISAERAARRERDEQILQLHAEGIKPTDIERRLGLRPGIALGCLNKYGRV